MRTAVLYNFLLEANIMASIAIVLMVILRKFFRKPLGNSALHFGWLLIAIRLLLPLSLPNPFIYLIRSPYAPDAAIRPIAGQVQVRLSDFLRSLSGKGMIESSLVQQAARSLNRGMYNASLPITLSKVYLAGVILVGLWFVLINVRFRRELAANRIEPLSGKLLDEYQEMCHRLKVKQLPVYLMDPLPSACLVGAVKPFIALPLTVSPKDALHVLRHELGHYQNRDHLMGLVRLLCCALHWFNPLVWMAAHMSYTDAELRCDERVTRPMDAPEKEAYAGVLVLSAARHNAPGLAMLATGMTQTHKKLKTRVTSILSNRRPIRALALVFVLLASLSLVGAFATHEMKKELRLPGLSPLKAGRIIQTEEEAIAYAKELLTRSEMKLSLRGDLVWEVIDNPDAEADWIVAGTLPGEDRALQSVSFFRNGRVLAIANHDSSWGPGFTPATLDTLLPEDMRDLVEDLVQYLRLMNPEEAVKVDDWMLEEYRKGDDIYLNFFFADKDFGWLSGEVPAAHVALQVAPVLRIIRMTFRPLPLEGNG